MGKGSGIFLIIPTIRSLSFLHAWKNEFADCNIIIVEDNPTVTIRKPNVHCHSYTHYCWEDIRNDLGDNEWIFSRRNAGIRSYGFWKAYQSGADYILTLDDDCYPVEKDFVNKHISNLETKVPSGWFPTFPHPDFVYTRGFPYDVRNQYETVVSHGLWSHNMDLDAKTQIKQQTPKVKPYPLIRQFVPVGYYFPMSSMNLAFKRCAVPLMYFPLMGSDPNGNPWGYDRYDDIWAGIFAKKVCDHLELGVVNGSPFIKHKKASDPVKNLQKEKTGMEYNEELWKLVRDVQLTKSTVIECYREMAEKICFPKTGYFSSLRRAMFLWADLFA